MGKRKKTRKKSGKPLNNSIKANSGVEQSSQQSTTKSASNNRKQNRKNSPRKTTSRPSSSKDSTPSSESNSPSFIKTMMDWTESAFSPLNLNRTIIGFLIMITFFGVVLGYSFDFNSDISLFFKGFFIGTWFLTAFLLVIKIILLFIKDDSTQKLKVIKRWIDRIWITRFIRIFVKDKREEIKDIKRWVNLLLVIIIPLSFAGLTLSMYLSSPNRYFRLFVVPKLFPLYIGATILLFLTSLEVYKNKTARKLLKNPLLYIFVGYLFWLLFNSASSIIPKISFYGSVVRQMGLISILSFMIVTTGIMVWIKGDSKRARLLIYFILFVGLILTIRSHYEITLPTTKGFRPSGFAGNSDFNGNHYIFLIFTSFFMIFSSRSIISTLFSGLVLSLSVSSLILTQTRGAVFGVGIASVATMFIFSPDKMFKFDFKKVQIKSAITFGFVIGGLLFYYLFMESTLPLDGAKRAGRAAANRMLDKRVSQIMFVGVALLPIFVKLFWSSIPLINRKSSDQEKDTSKVVSTGLFSALKYRLLAFGVLFLLALSMLAVRPIRETGIRYAKVAIRFDRMFDKTHGQPRFRLMPATFPMIKANAFKGVGRETYRVGFLKYKTFDLTYLDPGVNYRSSHNMYLDMLSMEGVPGFSFYMAILMFGLWAAFFRGRKQGLHKKRGFYSMAVGISIIGYMAHSLVSYDVLPSSMFMFAFVGIGAGLVFMRNPKPKSKIDSVPTNSKWGWKTITPQMTIWGIIFVALIPVSIYLHSHHTGDLLLSKLTRASGRLKGALQHQTKLSKQAKQLTQSQQQVKLFESGNNQAKLVNAISKSLNIPKSRFKNRPQVLRIMKSQLSKFRFSIANAKTSLAKKTEKYGHNVWDYATSLYAENPGLGYHNYMTGHLSQVLMRINPSIRKKIVPYSELKQFIIKTGEAGTKNNTNPESAFSRLSSSYYAMGNTEFSNRNYNLAYRYFKKALQAVSNSIKNDRLYYDTHRIKSVFHLERFCDMEKSLIELNKARKILQTSRKGSAKRGLRLYPKLYLRLSTAFYEAADLALKNGDLKRADKFGDRVLDIMAITHRLHKDATLYNLRGAKGAGYSKRRATLNKNIKHLGIFKKRLDQFLKNKVNGIPTTDSVTKKLKAGNDFMTYFIGKKRNPVYSRCMTKLNLMKGK
jgi:tetratricopeptide (TPR) repeat protein